MKEKRNHTIIENKEICPGIFDMRLDASAESHSSDQTALSPKPGQFFMLFTGDSSRLLPRPISVCDFEGGMLRLVYRVAGKGTEQFSHLRSGDNIDLIGPLGNGFPLEAPSHAVLIGGGIGLPPLLFLGKKLKPGCRVTSILGYRDSHLFLKDEFDAIADTRISTDDGSCGIHGTVLDVIKEDPELITDNSVIYACGPGPMLKAIQKYAAEREIECYISLEERMACGVGACLSCVCGTTDRDPHSNVNNARVCVDGPVFPAGKVVLG